MATESAVNHAVQTLETVEHHEVAFPPFDSSTFASQIFWLAISFGVLFYLMHKVIVPRIGGIFEDRQGRIQGDLAEAERMKQESDAAIATYERELADAHRTAAALANDTRAQLNADLAARRAEVEAKLAADVTAAEARIAEIKASAMAEVGTVATDTAEAVVQALLPVSVPRKSIAAAVASALKN